MGYVYIWMFPKIVGKTPKMDGLLWKTLLWFIMVYYGICLYMDVSKNSGKTTKIDGVLWKTLLWFIMGYVYIWMFPKIVGKTPKMDGLLWKTLLKLDDLGGPPLFLETPKL